MSKWISVKDRLPEPETEVLILAMRYSGYTKLIYNIITTAIYEDGSISTDDSGWSWYECDFDYDEEKDQYIISEGWWEYRHYNPEDVANNFVEDTVTHWMPLPEPPNKESEHCDHCKDGTRIIPITQPDGTFIRYEKYCNECGRRLRNGY